MSKSVPTAIPSSPENKNFWIPPEGSSGLKRSMVRRVGRTIDSAFGLSSMILRLRSGQAPGVCLRPTTSASRSIWTGSAGPLRPRGSGGTPSPRLGEALSTVFPPRLERKGLSLMHGSGPPILFPFPRLQGSVRKGYNHNEAIPTYLFLELGNQH
jgi:hypothetical protein